MNLTSVTSAGRTTADLPSVTRDRVEKSIAGSKGVFGKLVDEHMASKHAPVERVAERHKDYKDSYTPSGK